MSYVALATGAERLAGFGMMGTLIIDEAEEIGVSDVNEATPAPGALFAARIEALSIGRLVFSVSEW